MHRYTAALEHCGLARSHDNGSALGVLATATCLCREVFSHPFTNLGLLLCAARFPSRTPAFPSDPTPCSLHVNPLCSLHAARPDLQRHSYADPL